MNRVTFKAWAHLDDTCEVTYRVYREEIELNLDGSHGLDVFTTERGLEALVVAGTRALLEYRGRRRTEPPIATTGAASGP
jgi:hypothetical protein